MKKEDIRDTQLGTGSAENRNAQKNQTTDIDEQKKDVAQQAGLGRHRITDIEDLGGMSGRDDYAGGDADDMSNQSTDERTER